MTTHEWRRWPRDHASTLGELTEAERDEIELEENLQRKDLTAYERSKTLVQLAETARTVLREQADFPAESAEKSRMAGRAGV